MSQRSTKIWTGGEETGDRHGRSGLGSATLSACGEMDGTQLAGLAPVVPLPLCFAGGITGLWLQGNFSLLPA